MVNLINNICSYTSPCSPNGTITSIIRRRRRRIVIEYSTRQVYIVGVMVTLDNWNIILNIDRHKHVLINSKVINFLWAVHFGYANLSSSFRHYQNNFFFFYISYFHYSRHRPPNKSKGNVSHKQLLLRKCYPLYPIISKHESVLLSLHALIIIANSCWVYWKKLSSGNLNAFTLYVYKDKFITCL